MTVTIHIRPDVESRLQEKAAHSGLGVSEYVSNLVEQDALAPNPRGAAVLAALDSFMAQDAAEHRDTLAVLRTALDSDRPGQRRVFGEGSNPIPETSV